MEHLQTFEAFSLDPRKWFKKKSKPEPETKPVEEKPSITSKIKRSLEGKYPKWLSDINENPTDIEYRESFIKVYEYPPEVCTIRKYDHGYNISTPGGGYSDGSYTDIYTDEPKLSDKSMYYSGCGCTWDIDDEGNRFYLLDRKTRRPLKFEEIKNKRTIYNYLKNQRENPLTDDSVINF